MMDKKSSTGEQSSGALNEHHRFQLRLTFGHIDSLLTEVEHILADAHSTSPFNRYTGDTTPLEQKVAHDYALRIRAAMARIMKEQGIAFGEPRCGSRWAANTAMLYAGVSVELHPDRLRGYGQVSEAGESLLESIIIELNSLIDKLRTYLAQGDNANLRVRIERLEKASNDVDLLKELDRIITIHGLVEYRDALATIIGRMENKILEIGVFGRVSCGKSSLLNYLLESDYLPVGVTPVTAVSTRIRYGPLQEVEIEFFDEPPQIVGFSELWEFATERGNPRNAKHVTKINLKLPTSRLKEGVAFIDTPGLGSLATSGSADALGYLPRCDLGLLMIDAGSGISAEDLVVVDALYRAGASAMILISKADLFSEAEREQVVEYVTGQVQQELRISPPIFTVSVFGESSVLCDDWCKGHLQPMLESHHYLGAAITHRKIAVLRNAIIATLEARLTAARRSVTDERPEKEKLLNAFGEVEKSFENTLQESFELAKGISNQASVILKATADQIAVGWLNRSAEVPSQILTAKITELLARPTGEIEETYDRIRNQALNALNVAEKIFPYGLSVELPKALGMPPLDPTVFSSKLKLERPAMTTVLILPLLKWQLDRNIRKQIFFDLTDFLDLYAKQLRNWLNESVDALRKAFRSATDMYWMQLRNGEIPMSQDPVQTAADLSLLKGNL
jgi:GTP-binding protein EngB required for normal cell division